MNNNFNIQITVCLGEMFRLKIKEACEVKQIVKIVKDPSIYSVVEQLCFPLAFIFDLFMYQFIIYLLYFENFNRSPMFFGDDSPPNDSVPIHLKSFKKIYALLYLQYVMVFFPFPSILAVITGSHTSLFCPGIPLQSGILLQV